MNKQLKIINDVNLIEAVSVHRKQQKDPSIKMSDGEGYFKNECKTEKTIKGVNRFVSPHPYKNFFINDLKIKSLKLVW